MRLTISRNFAAYNGRGSLYLGKNELAKAEQDFDAANANTPGNANALALAYQAEARRRLDIDRQFAPALAGLKRLGAKP